MTLSTHVLDATTGHPAAGVRVRLERAGDDGWAPAGEGTTGPDGRLRLSGEPGEPGDPAAGGGEPGDPAAGGGEPGVYRMTFDSGAYFRARGCATFYPEVSITFEMTEAAGHYHVPLLLSPFAYSTYRGS
jgi:5-hydroxyisourate hydrolase